MQLRNISPLHAEILEGKYDDDLSSLRKAIELRQKSTLQSNGIRPGATVTIIDDRRAGNLAGKQARVEKVNQKTISIELLDETIPLWDRGYRVALELIAK